MNAANDHESSDEILSAGDTGGDSGSGQPPPATFEFLAHTLFTQALMALGRIPNPITRKAHRNSCG